MRKAGRRIDPADLPPSMEWEGELWRRLWERVSDQWRTGFNGPVGLDLNPAIALIKEFGWNLELALELLGVIVNTVLEEIGKKSGDGQPDQD